MYVSCSSSLLWEMSGRVRWGDLFLPRVLLIHLRLAHYNSFYRSMLALIKRLIYHKARNQINLPPSSIITDHYTGRYCMAHVPPCFFRVVFGLDVNNIHATNNTHHFSTKIFFSHWFGQIRPIISKWQEVTWCWNHMTFKWPSNYILFNSNKSQIHLGHAND